MVRVFRTLPSFEVTLGTIADILPVTLQFGAVLLANMYFFAVIGALPAVCRTMSCLLCVCVSVCLPLQWAACLGVPRPLVQSCPSIRMIAFPVIVFHHVCVLAGYSVCCQAWHPLRVNSIRKIRCSQTRVTPFTTTGR